MRKSVVVFLLLTCFLAATANGQYFGRNKVQWEHFQFDIAASLTNNRRRFQLETMPLWLVEGMAEYFSKGRIDPLTSMWIRDATIHNRLPDIRRLSRDPRYFPYRYGQALLAYIGAR